MFWAQFSAGAHWMAGEAFGQLFGPILGPPLLSVATDIIPLGEVTAPLD